MAPIPAPDPGQVFPRQLPQPGGEGLGAVPQVRGQLLRGLDHHPADHAGRGQNASQLAVQAKLDHNLQRPVVRLYELGEGDFIAFTRATQ
jgi:hypothetical protein